MMAYSEDHIALAAEYALGTLDAGERAQVESMMSADIDYSAVVLAWEHKLGALNQMVGSVEPRPELWEKIKAAISHARLQQAPIVLPQAEPVSAPSPAAPQSDATRAIAEAAETLGAGAPGIDISSVNPAASSAIQDNFNVIRLAV